MDFRSIFIIGSGQYADHSCPLACQNMMLAAYSLGLGSCWVGFGATVTEDNETNLLELQKDERIFGPILLGYPEDYTERPPKREPQVKWL